MSKRKSQDSTQKAKLAKPTGSQVVQVSESFIQCSKNWKLIDLNK